MSCRKAYELDLAGFLADPTGATWAEFRDHYPRCAACSSEVRAWTELHLALGSASHPDPEDLVRYVDGSTTLAPTMRHAIAEHLAACAACRDEAHTLRSFDPLAAPTTERTPRPRRRFAFPSVGRIVWHPAFAYAVALLAVLYPALSGRVTAPTVAVVGRTGQSRQANEYQSPRDDETAPPAKVRQPETLGGAVAGKAPAAASPPEERRLRKEADAPTAAPKALGSLDRRAAGEIEEELEAAEEAPAADGSARRDEETKAKSLAAARTRSRAEAPPPEILLGPGEPTITVPIGAPEVILRLQDAPPDVTECTLRDTERVRSFLVRRETEPNGAADRPAFRVPATLLLPGRYVLTLASGERAVGERRLRVAAP